MHTTIHSKPTEVGATKLADYHRQGHLNHKTIQTIKPCTLIITQMGSKWS
jgi:hypothetical protein